VQGVWGKSPSGVQGRSPGRGFEAILYFYGQILTNLTVYFSALINRLLLFKSALEQVSCKLGASVHMHRNAVHDYQANTVCQSCSK